MTTSQAKNLRTAIVTTALGLVSLLLVTAAKRYDASKETVEAHNMDMARVDTKLQRLFDAYCYDKPTVPQCKNP